MLQQETSADLHVYESFTREYLTQGVVTDSLALFNKYVEEELPDEMFDQGITLDLGGGSRKFVFTSASAQYPVNGNEPLYPAYAINHKLTYESIVTANAAFVQPGTDSVIEVSSKNSIELFRMPIPVMCRLCNLHDLSPEQRLSTGWNVNIPGGCYIVGGILKYGLFVERMRQAQVHVSVQGAAPAHARIILKVPRGTFLMAVNKSTISFDYRLCIEGFGKFEATQGSKNHGGKFNSLNVITLSKIINLFYHTREEPEAIRDTPISALFENAMLSFRTRGNNKENEIKRVLAEYAATKEYYNVSVESSGESDDSEDAIFSDFCSWIGVSKLTSRQNRLQLLSDFVEREIFPGVHSKSGKIQLLALMTMQLVSYNAGVRRATDLNNWGHRMLETCAAEISKTARRILRDSLVGLEEATRGKTMSLADVINEFSAQQKKHNVSSRILELFVTTRKRGVKDANAPVFVNDIDSINSMDIISRMRKIVTPTNTRTKSMMLRGVQESQWGRVCPAKTPDTDACGLTKHSAPGAVATIGTDPYLLIEFLHSSRMVSRTLDESSGLSIPVCVNAIPIGYCSDAASLQDDLAFLRRRVDSLRQCELSVASGKLTISGAVVPGVILAHLQRAELLQDAGSIRITLETPDVTAAIGETTEELLPEILEYFRGLGQPVDDHACVAVNDCGHIEISTNAGRLVRPVLYVEYDGISAKTLATTEELRRYGFMELLSMGVIGFLDSLEEEWNCVVKDSLSELDIENAKTDELLRIGNTAEIKRRVMEYPVTHVQMHGAAGYDPSIQASVFSEHQHQCRSSFAGKMIGQATSFNMTPNLVRNGKYSEFGQLPIVSPSVGNLFSKTPMPHGINLLTAFIAQERSQEDSIELSLSAARQFAYRRVIIHEMAVSLTAGASGGLPILKLVAPSKMESKSKFQALMSNGLPRIGARVEQGQCVISAETSDGERRLAVLGLNEAGYVKRVLITGDKKHRERLVRVVIENVLIPTIGDKFSSRQGQKFTVGVIKADRDMPTITEGPYMGRSVDCIANPHGMITRMTVGWVYELLIGRAMMDTLTGFDATMFEKREDLDTVLYRHLAESAQERLGSVEMLNGETGEMFVGEAFYGPCYIMQLNHMVVEKMQSRGAGKKDAVLGQGIKGRSRLGRGAIRFGAQERDNLIAHGSPNIAHDRMCVMSDQVRHPICPNCGRIVPDVTAKLCPFCGSLNQFLAVAVPQTTVATMNLKASMGKRISFRLVKSADLIKTGYAAAFASVEEGDHGSVEEDEEAEEEELAEPDDDDDDEL